MHPKLEHHGGREAGPGPPEAACVTRIVVTLQIWYHALQIRVASLQLVNGDGLRSVEVKAMLVVGERGRNAA